MTFLKPSGADSGYQVPGFSVPARPQFNSQRTSDRLRESSSLGSPPFTMKSNIRPGRTSVFKEVGLEDESMSAPSSSADPHAIPRSEGNVEGIENRRTSGSKSGVQEGEETENTAGDDEDEDEDEDENDEATSPDGRSGRQRQFSLPSFNLYSKLTNSKGRPRIKSTSGAPPGTISGLQRFSMLVVLIAVVLPTFRWKNGQATVDIMGADAGTVSQRETSPTKVCTRWALQYALLNGTLYLYGGRSNTEADQTSNTWNNDFLTLDLTTDWANKSPSLKGLEKPDRPPAVSMGYLWHDYNNLYLYGGEFSDSPYVDPAPASIWQYSIKDKKWTEFSDPKTSAGNDSEPANQAVNRAAEGAGISVPELGLSWYFGGHLDWATTPGWSRDTDRVYLSSLLEFTHPGYTNTGVDQLAGGSGAGNSGAYRNITTGGVQDNNFPERADGVLAYVPGWGEMGVLIGLAGGTENAFTKDLGTLDVYDIANSKWFHQKTSGDTPGVRVNPCAVVASASDGSSFQIYMFGGQNLPFGKQKQYDDMYILTIPSFTWLHVDQSNQDVPAARAGHACVLHDSQMVVIGGYLGANASCDPGMYVFDPSELKWRDSFKAAADEAQDSHPDNQVLAASYGYSVPKVVQKVIGGDGKGGATVTIPAAGSATGGPFATGKPPVFTITQAGPTQTVSPGGNGKGAAPDKDSHVNPGFVAVGVIAGLLGAAAFYLGFCAWLYRRQVRAYKRHLAVANRFSGASGSSIDPSMSTYTANPEPVMFGVARAGRLSRESAFAWVNSDRGPPLLADSKGTSSEESPGLSGTGSGSGPRRHSMDTSYRPYSSYSSDIGSGGSTEGLLNGQEPSFFNVVLGPRRALRVVNAAESP